MSIRTVGNRENFGLFNDTFSNIGADAGVSSLSTMNMEKSRLLRNVGAPFNDTGRYLISCS